MHLRLVFSNFTEYIKEHEYTDDSLIPYISEEEAKFFTDKVLNELEIDKEDIESFELERYWKYESDYKAEIGCKCECPDMEKLLRIADIWKNTPLDIYSSWNMPDNKMKYKLCFVWINC